MIGCPIMSHDIQRLDPAVLIDWLSGVYVAAGRGTDEALAIAGSLTRSRLVGHDSHGIGMTPIPARSRVGPPEPGRG